MTTNERVCIYTSIFDGFDDLKVPVPQTIACDYICFTDDVETNTVAPWRAIHCDDRFLPGADVRLRSRLLKHSAHRAMRETGVEYDFTIWVDASIRILRDTFAERFVEAARASGMALVRHPERDCIYEEVKATFLPSVAHKYPLGRLLEQAAAYREQGYPERNGLLACGVVARHMDSDNVRRIDEAWFDEVRRWSVQDQVALPYVLWRLGVDVGVVDLNLWRNPLFEVLPHIDASPNLSRSEHLASEFRALGRGDVLGTYEPEEGRWRLPSATFRFGPANSRMIPLSGDWDGDGLDSPGLYDPETATFFLRNTCSAGLADVSFTFGPPGAVPIVGDWYGSGSSSVGIYLPDEGHFALRACNEPGPADVEFRFGPRHSTLVPVTGDWNGDGRDRVGLYLPDTSSWFLSHENRTGAEVSTFEFGPDNGRPVVGDWNGDGTDEVGVLVAEQGQAFLADANVARASCTRALVEPPGAAVVAGRWSTDLHG